MNLDAATGKLRWYYQGVPNDFKDYDMQVSPRHQQRAGGRDLAQERVAVEGPIQQHEHAGLDQYQVRTWRAWYAHITLSMLALAWLAASRAQAEKKDRHQ